MSALHLLERRASHGTSAAEPQPSRRQIWTALIVYCAAFWGMVGYAAYDIFGR